MNNPMKFNRKILPCIFRQIGIYTRFPILKVLIPLLLVFLQFCKPLYEIARIPVSIAETESDTLHLNHFTDLIEDSGSYVFTPADTLRINENMTRISNGSGGEQIIFQSGQNYRDPATPESGGRPVFLKRNLNPKAVQSIDAHIDTFDYEVRDNLHRKFNKKLTSYSVTDEAGNYVEYSLLGIGKVRSEAVITGNKARSSIDDNYDIMLYNIPEGIKEEIILHNSNAPAQFKYRINTNLNIEISETFLMFGDVFVSYIYAYDSIMANVPVSLSITGPEMMGASSILTVDIDTVGAVYPITIDPTLTLQPDAAAGKDSYIQLSIPDDNFGTSTIFKVRGGANIVRSPIQWDLSLLPASATIDSANLYLVWEYFGGGTDKLRYIDLLKVGLNPR